MNNQISPKLIDVIKEQSETIKGLITLLQTLQDHYQTMALRCDNEIRKAEDQMRTFEYVVQLDDAYTTLDQTELA